MTDLEVYVGNERIVWQGKPDRKCFILECIFNPFLFVAIIWGAFDLFFIKMINTMPSDEMGGLFKGFFGVFILIHLMPVWIYLGGVIFSALRQRNIEYIITERGIYLSHGVFSKSIDFKPFAEINNINMHCGIIDRMTGCGDVTFVCAGSKLSTEGAATDSHYSIQDIPDYQKVFQLVRQMQTDIYSDTMYPNALRPENNPGYRTQYNPTDRYGSNNR
jgi:Predicted membrane protein